ncbi:MAG: Rieske (2Fe-2S) protein [Rothia sp. (in: high G+C Gram-positive bacteria)]|nr:Rieske (2Fe-2S) protein [Rothia sp. (in: high G+C Gram-positive bacteria)]
MTTKKEQTPLYPSRRTVLNGAGLSAAALPLASCANNQSSSSPSAGSPIDAQAPSQPTDVIAASEVPVGGAVKATAGNLTVMVTQPTEGEFKAFSSVCTHQGCVLNVQNKVLACPCHASQFSIQDGSVNGGPAPTALPEFKAEEKDGRIIVSQA